MSRVKSIERAFELLDRAATRPGGLSDLAERSGLPVSTTARLLKTLIQLGAVERHDDGVYCLGPTMTNLSARAELAGRLETVDLALLQRLASQLGEIVGLSVRSGDDVLYVVQADSPNEVQVRDWTGERVPLHVVSAGLVFLAYASPADLARYLQSGLRGFTPATISSADELHRRLDEVRRLGHAWTREEFHPGINSVAAPVLDSSGEVVAALHCHGPSYRFPAPGAGDQVADRVALLAARLSSTALTPPAELSPR